MNIIVGNAIYKSSLLIKNFKCIFSNRSYCPTRSILNVDTNVSKDVVIYSFEKVRQVRMFNLFGAGQLVFWNYWAYLMYTTIRDTPVDESKLGEDVQWYEKINLGQNKYRVGLTALCLLFGHSMFLGVLMYTRRCVRKLVLRRGGRSVVVSVFTPLGGTRTFSCPLANMSCAYSRDLSKWSTPIKIKDHSLFYTLDNRDGTFNNVPLFDATVGLKRSLN